MKLGVTGHQQLDAPDAWVWVEHAINMELDGVSPPPVAVTSLAVGADQLVASLVLRRGGQVHVVVPFPAYERTFAPNDLEIYRRLLAAARQTEVLETPGTDEDAYLAAGKRVVELSDLVLAVWNGLPAKGKGGTADIVEYAVARGVPLIHINPTSRVVTRR